MDKALPKIALVWTQFAPYHIDRCEAVGERMTGRMDVLAVEVATSSHCYAWAPSGGVERARKITLFPDAVYEDIGMWRRLRAMWRTLRGCRAVFMGIPYSGHDVIVLSWLLRLVGVRVFMMSDSKFDDMHRNVWFELVKSLLLSAYRGALVAGRRQVAYLHFLRFRQRPVLMGYDVVSGDRLRGLAARARAARPLRWEERDFLFVGRFVAKKRLLPLIEAYAAYVAQAGEGARRLVLAGSGPEEPAMRARIAELGLEDRVVFTGFLQEEAVAAAMDRALALLLVSIEEQWGLVVNEAVSLGLPVIVSAQAGASDLLARNLVNGYVVQPGDHEGLAAALQAMAWDEPRWNAKAEQSRALAWRGECGCFADAVELLIDPAAEPAGTRYRAFEESVTVRV